MRYIITSQQFDFFKQEGHLVVQNFFSQPEIDSLTSLLQEAQKILPSGRDLERNDPTLKKAMKLTRFAQLVVALFRTKQVKLGFTQFPPCYKEFVCLEDVSSITETQGWFVIPLDSDLFSELKDMPQKKGDIGFYDKKYLLDFRKFPSSILIISFCTEKARYKFQERDPHTHLLKKIGYGFGDALHSETHPLFFV